MVLKLYINGIQHASISVDVKKSFSHTKKKYVVNMATLTLLERNSDLISKARKWHTELAVTILLKNIED